MIRIRCFPCWGPGSIPGGGTKIPWATCHGQKNAEAFSLFFRATFWMRVSCLALQLHLCWDLSEVKWSESESRSVVSSSLRPHTVHGILQARILESVAFPFSRGSSQPRDQILLYCTQILYPLSYQGSPGTSVLHVLFLVFMLFFSEKVLWLKNLKSISLENFCVPFLFYYVTRKLRFALPEAHIHLLIEDKNS